MEEPLQKLWKKIRPARDSLYLSNGRMRLLCLLRLRYLLMLVEIMDAFGPMPCRILPLTTERMAKRIEDAVAGNLN